MSTCLWTEKYQPKCISDIIGNAQSLATIVDWLKNWNENAKAKTAKSFQKALLISGPSGIGKSSSIKTIAKELGFHVIERNASDQSKPSVVDLLEEVSQSHGIQSWLKSDNKKHFTKSLLILDEVDGMSTRDTGGTRELCLAISSSKIPIIFICNDREKTSIFTLARHCQDIRFIKPLSQQMLPRIKLILSVEGKFFSDAEILQILGSCNGDIRQALNILQMWDTNTIIGEQISKTKKDMYLSKFQIIPKFFEPQLSISEKLDWYFVDPVILILQVQDIYIDCDENSIEKISKAADSISEGDTIGRAISLYKYFELMPLEALLTCIIPPILSETSGFRGFPKVPSWLVKNAKQKKLMKYVQTLHSHIAPRTMADVTATLEYIPLLFRHLTLTKGQEGIEEIISFMDFHHMNKEDRDTILEILEYVAYPEEPAQLKSAFTGLQVE